MVSRKYSDEKYVLDLISEILSVDFEWQKTFTTLLGDPNKAGQRRKIPVDAFYKSINLIVEYREKQHSQPVKIMDSRMTISGVPRGVQRQIYDKRKELWAAENEFRLLVISYTDLSCKNSGKLLRNKESDIERLKSILKEHL